MTDTMTNDLEMIRKLATRVGRLEQAAIILLRELDTAQLTPVQAIAYRLLCTLVHMDLHCQQMDRGKP